MLLSRLWNSCPKSVISVQSSCSILSSYFIDGFVKVVDSLFQLIQPISTSQADLVQSPNELRWRLLDGMVVFSLGFMCIVGIEKRHLNLIRWPTLLLFIYRVVEYAIEHLHRIYSLKSLKNPNGMKACEKYFRGHMGHVEWIGHFLIPSIHLCLMTLFLWRSLPPIGPQPIKYNSTTNGRSRRASIENDEMRLLDISEQDD